MAFGKSKQDEPRSDPYNLKPKTFAPRKGCDWPLRSEGSRLIELDAPSGLAHLLGHAASSETAHDRTCGRAGESCRLTDKRVTLCAGHAKRLRDRGVAIARGAN